MKKIKVNFKFSSAKVKSAFRTVGHQAKRLGKVLRINKVAKGLVSVAPWLILILALTQIVFAVMIYGYKKDDNVTRAVAKIIPFPAAIADSNVVTYSDYLAEKDYIHHFYAATKQEGIDYNTIDNQILDQLVENRLLIIEANRYDARTTKNEIDEAMAKIIDQNGGQEKVEKVLSDLYGIDLKTFRHLVSEQLLRDKINSDVISHVTVNHILVRVDKDAPDDKVNEAKTKIDGYLNEIKGGADFAEMAKKNSEDIGSNEQGGALEPFAPGEMVDEFSEAAFATPVGEISAPVRTEFGWHIIKVTEKKGTIEKKFTDWLTEIKEKAIIYKLV